MHLKLTKTQKELLNFYIGELVGLKEIGRRVKKDPRTLKKELIELGILVPSTGAIWTKIKTHVSKKFFRPVPEYMREIITGLMLGDANLRVQTKGKIHRKVINPQQYSNILNKIKKIRNKVTLGEGINSRDIEAWNKYTKVLSNVNTANLRLHKSILEIDWVKILVTEFSAFIKTKVFVKPNKTKSTKWSCGFDTSSSIQFFELWRNWYVIEKGQIRKKLPKIKKITANALLHWYIDDGYLTKTELGLSTQNFNIDEQKWLAKMLCEAGIKAKIKQKRAAYYIVISTKKENITNFFDNIKDAKLYKKAEDCFPYKFSTCITKNEWKKELKKEHPEYFSANLELRPKLLNELSF